MLKIWISRYKSIGARNICHLQTTVNGFKKNKKITFKPLASEAGGFSLGLKIKGHLLNTAISL